ncbi:amidohydrolase [Paracoccus subflavus]|uniref:Amidohydrolase n=1 Tax=Paracoccus subflavus TaxID=2528244 RepID=A0A4Q9FVB3_9RHOB|nr:amidohydrolase family protein [Paracoccus subflavus]TBN36369.1 amidohydrolase [Paracoccus subflavus]
MPDTAVTDFHTHVVPADFPPQRGGEPLWPSMRRLSDSEAEVMIAGRVFRRIDARSWDVRARLSDMDRDGVDRQVLSPMPELLSYWFADHSAQGFCAHLNASLAEMTAARPDRFAAYGAVPMQAPRLAAGMVRDLAAAGFAGIEIGSHVNGLPLGHRQFDPVYEAAEAEGMVVMVHALHPAGLERVGAGGDAAVSLFPLESTLAALSMLTGGVLARFPGLKVVLAHGGGGLAILSARLAQVQAAVAPPHLAECGGDAADLSRRFHLDSIVYDPEVLRFLAARQGLGRVVMGSDYPFAVMQNDPAGFVREALGPGAAAVLSRRPDLSDDVSNC